MLIASSDIFKHLKWQFSWLMIMLCIIISKHRLEFKLYCKSHTLHSSHWRSSNQSQNAGALNQPRMVSVRYFARWIPSAPGTIWSKIWEPWQLFISSENDVPIFNGRKVYVNIHLSRITISHVSEELVLPVICCIFFLLG